MMKIEYRDGFRVVLIAETDLERIFMTEWEKRSKIKVNDETRMLDFHIHPGCIQWESDVKP